MKRLLRLQIPASNVNEPIVYKMVTSYNLIPNIKEASLYGDKMGQVILEIEGSPADVERGILYLRELDIEVEIIES